MVEILLIYGAISSLTIIVVKIHYNGYRKGYKAGFEQGRTRINQYALKVNEALNERIKELQSTNNEPQRK